MQAQRSCGRRVIAPSRTLAAMVSWRGRWWWRAGRGRGCRPFAVGVAELRFDCLRAEEQLVGGFLDGGAVGDDQRDATLLEDQRVRGGVAGAGGEGAWAAGPRPPSDAARDHQRRRPWRPCRRPRGSIRREADQSPVLIHPLDRVAVQLELADHGRWGVQPSRAQRRKRHRPLTSTTQLLKRQTMLSLNERHRTELSTLRPAPIQAPHASTRFSATGGRLRHRDGYRARYVEPPLDRLRRQRRSGSGRPRQAPVRAVLRRVGCAAMWLPGPPERKQLAREAAVRVAGSVRAAF